MAELHERWMDEPGPTDVMSFPMDELRLRAPPGRARLGPGAARRHRALPGVRRRPGRAPPATRLDDELHLLTVHGVLHLLGYDHAEPDEEREMFGLQAELLADWRTATRARPRRAAQRRERAAATTACSAPSASRTTPTGSASR